MLGSVAAQTSEDVNVSLLNASEALVEVRKKSLCSVPPEAVGLPSVTASPASVLKTQTVLNLRHGSRRRSGCVRFE